MNFFNENNFSLFYEIITKDIIIIIIKKKCEMKIINKK